LTPVSDRQQQCHSSPAASLTSFNTLHWQYFRLHQ